MSCNENGQSNESDHWALDCIGGQRKHRQGVCPWRTGDNGHGRFFVFRTVEYGLICLHFLIIVITLIAPAAMSSSTGSKIAHLGLNIVLSLLKLAVPHPLHCPKDSECH